MVGLAELYKLRKDARSLVNRTMRTKAAKSRPGKNSARASKNFLQKLNFVRSYKRMRTPGWMRRDFKTAALLSMKGKTSNTWWRCAFLGLKYLKMSRIHLDLLA